MRPMVLGGYAILCLLLAACGSNGNDVRRQTPPPTQQPPNNPPPNEPPPAGTLQFSVADLQVAESQASADVSITRTAGSHGAISVTVRTVDGTAVAGQDYTAVNTTVTFADGDTAAKTVTIPVLDDSTHESDETFTVALSDPTSPAVLGTQATASVTVENDDPLPPPPAQVSLNLGTKQLSFSWPAVSGITHYQLLESPDGGSSFTQVGANIDASATSATLDIAVHRHDWANARYKLAACNAGACTDSNEVDTVGSALQAIGYFKASNPATGDSFGREVALSADGNTLAVGAMAEDSNATGINGDETNNGAINAGAVYVFTRTSGGWSQQAYVKASNTGAGDQLGFSLALSADGNTLAVGAATEDSTATGINGDETNNGASAAGAVYVFTRAGSTWSQQAYVKASNTGGSDQFGFSLALSADGNTLAVGAVGEDSNATGINGDETNNSAGAAGAVYVLTRAGSTWSQQAYVKASNPGGSDQFGFSLALSVDGNTLAVGAMEEDSNATGINGDETNNGALSAGAVYVFARAASTWSQQAYVKASNAAAGDGFGKSVALSADGNILAVGAFYEDSAATGIDGDQTNNGAPSAGAVYMFTRSGSAWSQQAYVKASNPAASDNFGYSLALSADGDMLAVSADEEDSAATDIDGDQTNNGALSAGAVYMFTRAGSVWSQHAYVKASNTEAGDAFGQSVELSADGDTLAVGTHLENSAAAGINGDQSDNTASNAGAVYLY
jgi:trimeric autotransporter adhesin